MHFDYEKDPLAIEQESFRQIRALTDLTSLSQDEAQVAMRLIHSCGDPQIMAQLRFTPSAMEAGLAAIRAGAPVLCDVEMVRHGLTKRMLETPAHCFLNAPETPDLAKARGETRCMAALELWRPLLAGSVVLIGNAPTALFRLLEMVRDGAAQPALVIGMPVGFVGAAESKDALWRHCGELGLEAIVLLGRQGGSALTASAFNALLRISRGIYF
ncbi:precorrin-8X methylmutase [Hahella aquimaris]|uniref:precorrin-8X methylmutase n=1 Tax=Hahella sp. HNIBRBA332 TaxID=3015983 RepID=UPI00273C5BB9|nr:precorrin-8X methylmutase [Hahella sp. HNIBRBA332]WLQ13608.1 precorrin-8X methylmutase [Hahella sp. HNIBRBA332]